MSRAVIIVIVVLALAGILLAVYIAKLLRKSRELEKHIDYSKMQRWEDDD